MSSAAASLSISTARRFAQSLRLHRSAAMLSTSSAFATREELREWRGLAGDRKGNNRDKTEEDGARCQGPAETSLMASLQKKSTFSFVPAVDVPSFDGLDDIDPRGFKRDWTLTLPSGKIMRAKSLDKLLHSLPPQPNPTQKERSAAKEAAAEARAQNDALKRSNAATFQKRRENFAALEDERKAHHPDKEWKWTCAALLERLPVVLPEMETVEDEYQEALIKRYRDFGGGLDLWGIKREKGDENVLVGERDPDWIVDVLSHGGPSQAAWYREKLAEKRKFAGIEQESSDSSDGSAGANSGDAAAVDYDSDDELLEAQRGEGADEGVSIKRYEPAERTTAFEHDYRSLNRALDKRLYLVVKESSTGSWTLPNLEFDREDDTITMAETAKIALLRGCGKRLDAHMTSNCPAMVDWKKHSQEEMDSTGFFGEKTFTMRAELMGPQPVALDFKKYVDYAWVPANEIADRLQLDDASREHFDRILVDW